MALEMKLTQKLGQQLLMTPQLKQAIKLLQLGRLEYIDAIYEELLKNPVIEEVRDEDARASSAATGELQSLSSALSNPERAEKEPDVPKVKDDAPLSEEEYLSIFNDAPTTTSQKGLIDFSNRPSLEATLKNKESLADYLREQLLVLELSEEERLAAEYILGNLNSQGFLEVALEELIVDAGCSVQVMQRALEHVQSLEPAGIGARDLRECLLLQLDRLGRRQSLAASIVESHLKLLERKKYQEIAKNEHVQVEEVYTGVKEIQTLEPRPARQFISEEPQYIVPDIYVYKHEGEYVISLNEEGLPRLRVSPYYVKLARQKESGPEGAAYINERLKAATWLMKSIHQRQQTIYKVTESIVKFQKDFLEHGIQRLKPLVLKDVADDIGMHESTVSRVTSNKYVHTPQGVFELKFFFSSAIKTANGDIASSSIKERIKEIVAAEDPAKPISDQKIVEMLKEMKISIARRTVAKYRESLGILSSSKRKKLF